MVADLGTSGILWFVCVCVLQVALLLFVLHKYILIPDLCYCKNFCPYRSYWFP